MIKHYFPLRILIVGVGWGPNIVHLGRYSRGGGGISDLDPARPLKIAAQFPLVATLPRQPRPRFRSVYDAAVVVTPVGTC